LCAAEKIKDNSRAQKFRGAKGKDRRPPTQGTLRTFNGKNQRSREQFHAYSGATIASNGDARSEEINFTGFSGKVQSTTAGASSEV